MGSVQKIGILGGSFDPIHYGHLNLALELLEKENLTEVWFVPAKINPHKVDYPPASFEHRCAMINCAIEKIPYFHLKDFEKKLPTPSYTFDMLKTLIAQNENQNKSMRFYLLMGEDTLTRFAQWRNPEGIVALLPLLIGTRSMKTKEFPNDLSNVLQSAIKSGLIKTKLMDIASSDIRARLKQKLFCGHLTAEAVLDYIHKNDLYR